MMKTLFALGLFLQGAALELTAENWEAETSGKAVFVKFLAPW